MPRTISIAFGAMAAILVIGALMPKPVPVQPRSPQQARPASAPTATASPTTVPPPPQPTVSANEVALYQKEIALKRRLAEIRTSTADQMVKLEGYKQAEEQFKKADYFKETATCLENQLARQVPFYEGRARCAAVAGAEG
ncbi:hypothetical protein [Vulcanococcus limneticus]|uniref:hypothetical protein n=1 Tax=Vulcanococcus limneticus TaxID=2170428 RepID=UPI00398BCF2E